MEAHVVKVVDTGKGEELEVFVIHIVCVAKELQNSVEGYGSCVSSMGLHFITVTLLIMYFFN